MRVMSREELRKCQINILDYIAELCAENNIAYWIDYGTLLGAVRHKGYIPWDDDIDVAMLREDYERFITICKMKSTSQYRLSCVEIDPECMYPFGKMIDTQTVLYELGEDGIKTGVFVDIFVYDNAPRDEEIRKKIYDKLDWYGHLRKYQLPLKNKSVSIKRFGVLCARTAISLLPKNFFTKKIVLQAQKYKGLSSDMVCDYTCPYYNKRWLVDKAMFQDLIDIKFENKVYKAPRRYDEWLTLQYGDYMKLPSPEDQKTAQHDMTAYIVE